MDKIAIDYKVILSNKFVCDNNLISQLGAKIFVICEQSICYGAGGKRWIIVDVIVDAELTCPLLLRLHYNLIQ